MVCNDGSTADGNVTKIQGARIPTDPVSPRPKRDAALGLIAGYRRGWVDSLMARGMDIVLAFPVLVLAIGIGVACSGQDGCANGTIQPGLNVVIVGIVIRSLPHVARPHGCRWRRRVRKRQPDGRPPDRTAMLPKWPAPPKDRCHPGGVP